MAEGRDVPGLLAQFQNGHMSRRQLIRSLAYMGLSASVMAPLLSACGGEGGGGAGSGAGAGTADGAAAGTVTVTGATADERALNAARQLAAAAKKKSLTVLYPAGSLGNMKPFVQEWKDATGMDFNFVEAPDDRIHDKGMEEAVAKSGAYDLILPIPISIPDFAESGLIYDLTPWVQKYNPEIDNGPSPVPYPLSAHGCLYKGKVYGLISDGDQWTLFMRADRLNDPAEKEVFKRKYGRELAPPETWAEYDQLVEFFNRPNEGMFGSLEFRSRFYVKWQWMQRFVSKGKLYFDDNMKFLGNSPEGIQTLKELIALNQYLPPDSKNFGWSEAYAAFGQGRAFSGFFWPSGYKYNNDPKIAPKTAGKIVNAIVPGTKIGGKVIHAAMFPFGWSWVVSKYSANPELAYLYAQWMFSPKMSTRAIPQPQGFFDVFRTGHFDDPDLEKIYSKAYLATARQNIVHVIPDFCLKGGNEYGETLDKNLHEAVMGLKTPEQSMAAAEKEMEEITERMGRSTQIQAWTSLRATFPKAILEAAGVKV